jgi:uncharacterized protein YodC (DUF2158 family)
MAKKVKVFEVGDLVRLKSGGPLMTVCLCEPSESGGGYVALCCWFPTGLEHIKPPNESAFPVDALKQVPA